MTPCDPEVIELMKSSLSSSVLGNPSSNHAFGWRANERYELAKEIIADVYNALPDDVIFTSGASEANNHAILGVVQAAILNKVKR
ncbi:MAG: aminotransferase class V-fold PLP-dependent enzyme, partial [Crenarchaeota archaeon]|nr:aminotransferase class V-fold PLP-dependent enzyme [Thermoproteota archaeon]